MPKNTVKYGLYTHFIGTIRKLIIYYIERLTLSWNQFDYSI